MCHNSTDLGHFPGQCLKMVIRKSNFRNYIHLKASSEAELSGRLLELNWLQVQVYSGQRDLFSSITACSAKNPLPFSL